MLKDKIGCKASEIGNLIFELGCLRMSWNRIAVRKGLERNADGTEKLERTRVETNCSFTL